MRCRRWEKQAAETAAAHTKEVEQLAAAHRAQLAEERVRVGAVPVCTLLAKPWHDTASVVHACAAQRGQRGICTQCMPPSCLHVPAPCRLAMELWRCSATLQRMRRPRWAGGAGW